MHPTRRRIFLLLALVFASGFVSSCRRAIVIVPATDRGYTARDTLYGTRDGSRVRVTFRHDTTWRVDTVIVMVTDTLYRGTRVIARRDTVFVRDTVVRRVGAGRVDTVRVNVVRVDTVRVSVVRVDTVRVNVVRVDTVRVAGQRTLFVPPGHYPPDGQCRVWIHDKPPGQQDRAAACNALGAIPAGAFVLFGGDAWDFDYDWIAAASRMTVPPQIVALKRR